MADCITQSKRKKAQREAREARMWLDTIPRCTWNGRSWVVTGGGKEPESFGEDREAAKAELIKRSNVMDSE